MRTSRRWTEAEVTQVQQNLKESIRFPLERHKYGNTRVTFQGMKFDSQKELADWRNLKALELTGAIRAVVRQVSLPLPGSTRRIRIDHMVVENDGRICFKDSKGYDTHEGKLKRDQVEQAYGIKVELI